MQNPTKNLPLTDVSNPTFLQICQSFRFTPNCSRQPI
jgi:hypothetical protein